MDDDKQRNSIKHFKISSQAHRRDEFLKRQKKARQDMSNHARDLAMGSMQSAQGSKKSKNERFKRVCKKYYNQLMTPEWLLQIPNNLNGKDSTTGEGWYVIPRPEGKRCLVISSAGETIARIQSGSIFKRFPSALPNGCRKGQSASDNYCILDCIFHESNKTFYVVDMMCWKGYLLYDCTAEFRMYWARSKLVEHAVNTVDQTNPYRFVNASCYECDSEGLTNAYSSISPYLTDGLLFYLKSGRYELGVTPLVLLWKDDQCSRYYQYGDQQTVVLLLLSDGLLCTSDNIVVHSVDQSFLIHHGLNEGDLLRFAISGATESSDGQGRILMPVFQKKCSMQRGLADSWSKVMFQCRARGMGLPFEKILEGTQQNKI